MATFMELQRALDFTLELTELDYYYNMLHILSSVSQKYPNTQERCQSSMLQRTEGTKDKDPCIAYIRVRFQ